METLWVFLEEPGSSPGARMYALVMSLVITLSVLFTVILEFLQDGAYDIVYFVDTVFDLLFAVEIGLRLLVCPRRLRFLRNPYNIIDVLSVMPRLVQISTGFYRAEPGSVLEFLLLMWPLLRLLKAARNFTGFRLLMRSLIMSLEALPVPLFMLLTLVVAFASVLYFFEPRDNLESVPHAMWLVVVTITTVGYGDVYCVTDVGRCITSLLIVVGCFYMAMPLSIVGTNFANVWQQRDKILLMDKVRLRLIDWGYSPDDVKAAFKIFDLSGDGELDVHEFAGMINEMHLGIPQARILELFQAFDEDNSGTISATEFTRHVFPKSWTLEFYIKEFFPDQLSMAHSPSDDAEGESKAPVPPAPPNSLQLGRCVSERRAGRGPPSSPEATQEQSSPSNRCSVFSNLPPTSPSDRCSVRAAAPSLSQSECRVSELGGHQLGPSVRGSIQSSGPQLRTSGRVSVNSGGSLASMNCSSRSIPSANVCGIASQAPSFSQRKVKGSFMGPSLNKRVSTVRPPSRLSGTGGSTSISHGLRRSHIEEELIVIVGSIKELTDSIALLSSKVDSLDTRSKQLTPGD